MFLVVLGQSWDGNTLRDSKFDYGLKMPKFQNARGCPGGCLTFLNEIHLPDLLQCSEVSARARGTSALEPQSQDSDRPSPVLWAKGGRLGTKPTLINCTSNLSIGHAFIKTACVNATSAVVSCLCMIVRVIQLSLSVSIPTSLYIVLSPSNNCELVLHLLRD